MTTISFDYKPWDHRKDVPLFRPGSEVGYGAVRDGIQVGHAPTERIARADRTIGPTVDGVIGLLAGCVEWLREYGLEASDVQARVRAYTANNRSSEAQQNRLAVQPIVSRVSDPNNWFKDLSETGKRVLAGREPS